MRLTTVALTFFWVLSCDGSAGGHVLTTIRMAFPRNASNNRGVDVFRVLFCDGSAGGHIWTNIRTTCPRNASNSCGVGVFVLVSCCDGSVYLFGRLCACVSYSFPLCFFFISLRFDDRCSNKWVKPRRTCWHKSSKCQSLKSYSEKHRNTICWMRLKRNVFRMSLTTMRMITNAFTMSILCVPLKPNTCRVSFPGMITITNVYK